MRKKIMIGTQFHIVLICLLFAELVWSANYYVSSTGGGDGSIASPTDLQTALDLARTNGTADTIYLMEGEYDASTSGANTYEYGSVGNDGMKTTLSGSWDSSFTVQKTFDAPSTRLDALGTCRVMSVHADGVSFDFAIEYIQLENGYIAAGGGHGAGLLAYNENGGELKLMIKHVSFEDNTTEINLVTQSYGGGIYSNCYFEIKGARFKDNQAVRGGAMYIADKPGGDTSMAPLLEGGIFEGNISGNASAPGVVGSTILYSCSPVITDSTFQAPDYVDIGFYPNSCLDSGYGAGTLTLSNSTFIGFKAYYWGGALSLWNTNANISDCLFIDNSAGNSGDGAGGAITLYDNTGSKTATITNCTFVGNRTNGGQLYGGAIHNRLQTLTVINSIFWDNGMRGLYKESGNGTVSFSVVDGGVTDSNMTDGGSIITDNPLFVETSGLAETWDLHLQELSPCIDSGSNSAPYLTSVDLDGNVRIWDGDKNGTKIVDMGCYELITKRFSWTQFMPAIIRETK